MLKSTTTDPWSWVINALRDSSYIEYRVSREIESDFGESETLGSASCYPGTSEIITKSVSYLGKLDSRVLSDAAHCYGYETLRVTMLLADGVRFDDPNQKHWLSVEGFRVFG